MRDERYGLLLNTDAKLHRRWFEEMTRLIGISVIHQGPRLDKTYTTHTEEISTFYKPVQTGCIFEEHPKQQTMKKLGWASEQTTQPVLIHVPYDLEHLAVGSLFIIPSGIDNTQGRVFRVTEMAVEVVYPASITCKLVPEYKNVFDKSSLDYKHSDFNLLNEEESDI